MARKDKKDTRLDVSSEELQTSGITEEDLKQDLNKNTSTANTSQAALKQGVSSINKAKQSQAEQAEETEDKKNVKEEFLDRTRDSLDSQFSDAMSYFGPRLVAQLFGGSSAMAMTDKVMSGFEGYQSRQLARKEHAEDRKHLLEQRRLKALQGPQQTTAEKKLAFEERKYKEAKEEKARQQLESQSSEMQSINNSISRVMGVSKDLKSFPGAVGFLGGSSKVREADLALGDDPSASAREDVRLRLEAIWADDALEKVSKLKGSLSDKDLAFVQKGKPTLRSSKTTIEKYLNDYQDFMQRNLKDIQSKQAKTREKTQSFLPGSIIKDETGKLYTVMPDGSIKEK